jgi:transposase
LPEAPPDHSTISRTRRLFDLETHQAVFTWIVQRLAEAGLVKGRMVGIDATTWEANAALRSVVRRDTWETYQNPSAIAVAVRGRFGRDSPTNRQRSRLSIDAAASQRSDSVRAAPPL